MKSPKRRGGKAFLICFAGMDGAGKTTQAKSLVAGLKAKGIESRYVWNTYQLLLTKPFVVLGRLMFFRGKNAFYNYSEYDLTKKRIYRNPVLSWVYQYLSLFDYLWQSFLKITIPLALGKNIVSDRYVHDVVVNLAVDFNYPYEKTMGRLRSLLRLLPEPDLLFVMDVPESVGYGRKDDTPSVEYLRERRRLYSDMGKGSEVIVLDGTTEISKLEGIVQNKVYEVLIPFEDIRESPTIKLLKIIGSPFEPRGDVVVVNSAESRELFNHATRNKLGLLYLETLQKQGALDELREEYEESRAKYDSFLGGMAGVSAVLGTSDVKHVIVKSLRPYPAVPSDVDVVVLNGHDAYKLAIETLLKADYAPLLSHLIDAESLTTEEAYAQAAEILTRPTWEKAHISPTSATFVDSEHRIHIDLQNDIAASYVTYVDKDRFEKYLSTMTLPNGQGISALVPELELVSVIAHSVMERSYRLGEFYTFLHYLSKMDERQMDIFVGLAYENKLGQALRAFTSLTAQLHKAAFDTIPPKVGFIIAKIGFNSREAGSLEADNFHMPHRYRLLTMAGVFFNKMGESKFRKGVSTQLIKMLNPKTTRLVIGELMKMGK